MRKPEEVTFAVARNIAFYELTLFLPIVCMCILVVLGIWMPVSSGETLGFQVTMLLTMIVYLDVLSRNGSRRRTLELNEDKLSHHKAPFRFSRISASLLVS